MEKKIYDYFKLILFLFIFINIGYIFGFIFSVIGFDLNNFNTVDSVYADVLLKSVIFIMIFLGYKNIFIDDWRVFREKIGINLQKCLQLFVMLLVVKVISSVVVTILGIALGMEVAQSDNQNIIDSYTGVAPIMMFIASVILAPFYEEGMFRLGFKRVFRNKYTFIILSGAIFGLIHIFPTQLDLSVALIQSIPYIAMGICLAYIYAENTNIYFAIIVHALNNLLGIIAILFFL